jgi:hypothetical protein
MEDKVELFEKYMSPNTILPNVTSVWKDLPMQVVFGGNVEDLPMSATFVQTESGGGGTSSASISVYPGTALAVAGGATNIVVTKTVTSNSGSVFGYQCSGDADAVYSVFLNGTMIHRFTTNIIVPNINYSYPVSITLETGDIVQIQVSNTNSSTSDFLSSIIGFF